MTIYSRSEELVSRCVECDLAEPESLTSLGGSAPGFVDGILSTCIGETSILTSMVSGKMMCIDNGSWLVPKVRSFGFRCVFIRKATLEGVCMVYQCDQQAHQSEGQVKIFQ